MKWRAVIHLLIVVSVVLVTFPTASVAQPNEDPQYRIALKSRQFIPVPGVDSDLTQEMAEAADGRRHVLLQFMNIPTDPQRVALEARGVRLLSYVPNYTWFASLPTKLSLQEPAMAPVRWIGAVQPQDRLAPILRERGIREDMTDDHGRTGLDVRFFADVSPDEALRVLETYGAAVETKLIDFNRFLIRVDPGAIAALSGEDGVQWITEASPPKTTDNDGTRARTNVDTVQAAPYDLSGADVDLGVWDSGKVDTHVDFSGRLTVVDSSASVSDHGTHVAGTMAGDGSNSVNQGGAASQWRGMAPGADIFSYKWDNNLTDHNGAINTYGIELSQNSWGYTVDEGAFDNCYLYGNYDYDAPDYDDIITGLYGKRIAVVFSAGNERNDGDCGMSTVPPYINYATVGPPATAKNVIAVGATNSNDDSMTTFSSWGPMDDGRIKPDVVAPGCESTGEGYIHSTLPGNVYGGPGWCGTSMAAPAVSGISGLLIQQYRSTFASDPLPSTLKALLVQTALDMNDGTTYYNPGPDYASGYGRLDAQAAVDEIIAGHVRQDQLSNGQTDVFTVDVVAGTPTLKVTLAWDDEPGAVNANPALVNNLNLVLVEPNGTTTHLPWVLNPANPSNNATTGTDNVNNLEQVEVNNPAAGTWEVRVIGAAVPVGPQQYSLAGQTFGTGGPSNVGPLEYDSHLIDDDNVGNSIGNDDGVVNPGETIELYADLHNAGSDGATAVQAIISTASPYVTFIFNTASDYGDIPGGGTAINLNDFDFEVSSSAPDGHIITFNLNVTAANGGPWSDSFEVAVAGDAGGGSVALISDQTELQAITPILDDIGLPYDVINNNWNGTQGIYTSDYSFLSDYDVVLWYASGATWGRLTTLQEHDALEQYLQAGGRLLVTGYDTLGSPTDPLLADLIRSSSSGDGPFTYDYTVTDGGHPITAGPYGSFPAGTALMAGRYDHDQAEADTARGATTVAELSGGRDKILATELTSGGIVVYWNGNRNASDWTGVLTALQEQGEDTELKRNADGNPVGGLSIEVLRDQAQRVEPADVPPEANYGGSAPVWYVPPEVLFRSRTVMAPLDSQSVTFPASGDTINVTYNPYWWNAGDYAEGTRTLSLDTIYRVDYDLYLNYNILSGSGHVDLELIINGSVVGGFTVLPGEYQKSVSFTFSPINGPVYSIRLEETNTVDPGMGSISIPLDTSKLTFFGPSTEDQVAMLKNTLYWLSRGAVVGDPHEPNDAPDQCTPISFNVAVTDPTIDPAGDYDYYCFTGSAGQTIATDIDAVVNGSLLDPVLTLFDSDGTTFLTQNDDYGGSLDSYLEYTLPRDDTFYLRVRSYGHPCCGGAAYTYSILLTDITAPRSLPFFDDMESGTNGWGADGLWHQVQDGISPYPNSFSPTHSWWYGQDSTGDYNTGAATSGNLTSPPIEIPPGVQAALRFRQWYETEPLLLAQSVYFDAYHDNDGDSISGGSYSNWANDLINAGYSVVEYDQPIDLATLSGHQVLALFDPEIALSVAEIAAINTFMQEGGRVVALGEWGDVSETNTILNALSATHGITFNADTLRDSTDNDGQDSWPLIYNFAHHPLVRGVNTVAEYVGASLSLGGPAVPLASGDSDTSTAIAASGAVEGTDEYVFDGSQFLEPHDIVPDAPVAMAHASVGAGELVAIGDSNLWSNVDLDGDGVIALFEYSNLLLSRRVFGREVDHPSWDQKWIQISVDGGPFQNLRQVTGGPMNAWHQRNVDLSAYADSTVRLRFHFDSFDSALNSYRGWYVDDVLVETSDVGPLGYNGHTIDDDNVDESAGDEDGVVDPGETIELYVELFNQGADSATTVQACIAEDSPYVNGFLFNTCSGYGDIAGGGTATNSNDFDFYIDPAAPNGHTIHFDLAITADDGGPWSTAFDIVVGQGTTVGPLIYVGATIDDDNTGESVGNGDGEINPGETIELFVEVLNAGNAPVSAVEGAISESSPYVNGFLYNTASPYGDIPGGGSAINSNDFDFEVDINAPDGHPIPLCLGLSAGNGGPWTVCFDIPVVGTASGAALRVEPPDQEVALSGGTFQVDVMVESVNHLGVFQFDLTYDPARVHVDGVTLGPFLGSSGCSVEEVAPVIDNVNGRVSYGGFVVGTCSGPSGDGVVATITFQPVDVGEGDLILENEELWNTDDPPAQITPIALFPGHVTVTDCFFADVDCDADVDIGDIFSVAFRWGRQCGTPSYAAIYDLDGDCSIDVGDIQIAACHFGWPSGDFSVCYTPTSSSLAPLPGQLANLHFSSEERQPEVDASQSARKATVMQVKPHTAIVKNGETFRVDVMVQDAVSLGAFQFVLDYDPAVLEVPNLSNPVTLGSFLSSGGRSATQVKNDVDPMAGVITYTVFTLGSSPPGPDGDGRLAFVDFRARALGTSSLDLQKVVLRDIGGYPQIVSLDDGQVIVAAAPNPAQVTVRKSVDPSIVAPGDPLTYTLQRSFSLAGPGHSYEELLFDYIPSGATYVAGSVTLNGLSAPELYSPTLDAIYYQPSGSFTDTDQLSITFQVQVGSLPSGTLILNRMIETASLDGAAYTGPYTATAEARVVGRCVEVTDVDPRLLTGGGIYTDTVVQFSTDISPDDASKPYNYIIDYDDGTELVTDMSSDDPLVLDHTFAAVGNYNVEIAAWNCGMTAPFTATIGVTVKEPEVLIFLPLVLKDH
jgi:uncharacterized repeat protein (TIGR01451 family)